MRAKDGVVLADVDVVEVSRPRPGGNARVDVGHGGMRSKSVSSELASCIGLAVFCVLFAALLRLPVTT